MSPAFWATAAIVMGTLAIYLDSCVLQMLCWGLGAIVSLTIAKVTDQYQQIVKTAMARKQRTDGVLT